MGMLASNGVTSSGFGTRQELASREVHL